MYRRAAIAPIVASYLNDIDVPPELGNLHENFRFAKVDVAVRHLFCSGIRAFVRKQTRRVRDYFSTHESPLQNSRTYPWSDIIPRAALRFAVSCALVVPLLYQSARAFISTKERAAFFHPVACWLTLGIYGWNFIFLRGKPMSRDTWAQ
jgi:hypothetical protein